MTSHSEISAVVLDHWEAIKHLDTEEHYEAMNLALKIQKEMAKDPNAPKVNLETIQGIIENHRILIINNEKK